MRFMKFASIAALGLSVIASGPVAAQPAPGAKPAASVSPEVAAGLKQARAMSEMLKVNEQVKSILNAMRNQMVQATIQASGKSVEDAAKIVDELLMPDFNAAIPDLTESMLQPWANNFTAADMKTLQEFYSTPVGAKLLKNAPIVGQEVQQATQAWTQNTFRQAVQKHAQELRDRGLKF
jgi:hypothetical protein